MIQIDKIETAGWFPAIKGMRNPLNSWNKSDTTYNVEVPDIGEADMKLMKGLCKAGSADRKFLRMIIVYADINAPLYWWKEYDTYKVGTVANSCSTMHKIHSRDLTEADFSMEDLNEYSLIAIGNLIERINEMRQEYMRTRDRQYWRNMIQLLPTCYNQHRTVMVNYEVLRGMYQQRKNHKLQEWRDFCSWIETLPYAKELIIDVEGV